MAALHAENPSAVSYLTYGREIAPTTSRQHLQGFVRFRDAKTFRGVKALFEKYDLGEVHLEARKGTIDQAIDYCHKEGDKVEFGKRPPGQGARSDVAAVAEVAMDVDGMDALEAIRKGVIKRDGDLTFFYRVRDLAQTKDPFTGPVVHWFFGPTGTGKTWQAMLEASAQQDRPFLMKEGMSKWWPGAERGTEYVVWDEFRPNYREGMSYEHVLSLLGIGRPYVEVKGSQVLWRAKEVWITTPYSPVDCGPAGMGSRDSVAQLVRRVADCRRFTAQGTWTTISKEELMTEATTPGTSASTSFSPVTRTTQS